MPRYFIIAAVSNNYAIGKNGKIPWHVPDDLQYFNKMTLNSIIIMGRKTYFDIPQKNRPLKNRMTIVLTNNPSMYNNNKEKNKEKEKETLFFMSPNELEFYLNRLDENAKVFIAGGSSLYEKYIDKSEIIYLTKIYTDIESADALFPYENLTKRKKIANSEILFCNKSQLSYEFLIFI